MWSYGVTLWEIVTKQDPFASLDPVQAALLITSDKEPLRLVIPDTCPKVIRDIMEQCFETDPSHRPSFKKVCETLENCPLDDWSPSPENHKVTYAKLTTITP